MACCASVFVISRQEMSELLQYSTETTLCVQFKIVISVLIFYNKFPLTNYAGRNKVDENYGCIYIIIFLK